MVAWRTLTYSIALLHSAQLTAAQPAPQSSPEQPSADPTDQTSNATQAEEHYRRAVQHYGAGRFVESLQAFERAASFAASPNAQLGIARSLKSLNRLVEAANTYRDLQRQLHDAPSRYATTARAAQSELNELLTEIGRLRIAVEGANDAAITIEDADFRLRDQTQPIFVLAGRVEVTVRADGFVTREVHISIRPGEEQRFDVVLRRASTAPDSAGLTATTNEPAVGGDTREASPLPLRVAWSTTAIAIGGIAAFGILGAVTAAHHRDFQDNCVSAACADDAYATQRTKGRNLQLATNLSLAVASAAAIVAVISFVIVLRAKGRPLSSAHSPPAIRF